MKTIRLKRLVLIRHAHRDTSQRDLDNGLSDKGRDQVKKLIKHARAELIGRSSIAFLSSPKLRCVQTIEPIVEDQEGELEISALLDEGDRLEKRVDEFIAEWRSSRAHEITVVCSHGDWIPLCLRKLTGQDVDIAKGGWAEVSLSLWEGP